MRLQAEIVGRSELREADRSCAGVPDRNGDGQLWPLPTIGFRGELAVIRELLGDAARVRLKLHFHRYNDKEQNPQAH